MILIQDTNTISQDRHVLTIQPLTEFAKITVSGYILGSNSEISNV